VSYRYRTETGKAEPKQKLDGAADGYTRHSTTIRRFHNSFAQPSSLRTGTGSPEAEPDGWQSAKAPQILANRNPNESFFLAEESELYE